MPHEFKLVLSYRSFLDYTAQCIDMYRECPRPNNIEKHDPEAFDEWMDMAKSYKASGEIIQFASEDEEWSAWMEYAMKAAMEGVEFNAE